MIDILHFSKKKIPIFFSRSHALRGNACWDAPRPAKKTLQTELQTPKAHNDSFSRGEKDMQGTPCTPANYAV